MGLRKRLRKGERLRIGDDIEVEAVRGATLVIHAPRDVKIGIDSVSNARQTRGRLRRTKPN